MKQALILGGGSKLGKDFTQLLVKRGYHVHVITGSSEQWGQQDQVTVMPVNWHTVSMSDIRTLLPKVEMLDLVLFNQNSSALNSDRFRPGHFQRVQDWQQSYFVSCQLPYYLVHALHHKLTAQSKVVWMLSSLIKDPVISQIGFADYIGNKFVNACIMKNFALHHHSCFFAVYPESGIDVDQGAPIANQLLDVMHNDNLDHLRGKIFDTQGQIMEF